MQAAAGSRDIGFSYDVTKQCGAPVVGGEDRTVRQAFFCVCVCVAGGKGGLGESI